jgi:hypothetical protein
MTDERRSAYRLRARILGRSALAIGIAPALFFLWNSIGLPGIPGIDFGGAGGAQADPGLVVRIGNTSPLFGRAPFRRASTHIAAAHKPRASHPATAAASPPHAPATVTGPNRLPTRTPEVTPPTGPPAPSAPVRPETPVPAPPAETTVTVTTPTLVLPALPQLPTVPTPQIPLPPLPALTPVLPALPPIGTVGLP